MSDTRNGKDRDELVSGLVASHDPSRPKDNEANGDILQVVEDHTLCPSARKAVAA